MDENYEGGQLKIDLMEFKVTTLQVHSEVQTGRMHGNVDDISRFDGENYDSIIAEGGRWYGVKGKKLWVHYSPVVVRNTIRILIYYVMSNSNMFCIVIILRGRLHCCSLL